MLDLLSEYDGWLENSEWLPVGGSTGGLQVFEDGEWQEWTNVDGQKVGEAFGGEG